MNRYEAVDAVREIMAGPRAYEAERLDRIAGALRPWTPEMAAYSLAATGHSEEPQIGMKWRSAKPTSSLWFWMFSRSR